MNFISVEIVNVLLLRRDMPMDKAKLHFESVIFQVKFDKGFLYWDNCGKIWRKMTEKWKDLQMVKLDTQNAVLQLKEERFNLGFDHNNFNTSLSEPPLDLKSYAKFTHECMNIVCDQLDIDIFTRVGNRLKFLYPLQSREEMKELLIERGILTVSDKKLCFSDKTETIGLEKIQFTIKEKSGMAYHVRFSFLERTFEASVPPSIRFDDSKYLKKAMLVDIDRHTELQCSRGSLDAGKLIEENLELIYNKIEAILGS